MNNQVITVTIQDTGIINVEVRGSELSPAGYGSIVGTIIKITANMFAQHGVDNRATISAILKEANKSAYSKDDLNMSMVALH